LTANANVIINPILSQPSVPTFLTPNGGSGSGATFSVGINKSDGFQPAPTTYQFNLRFGTHYYDPSSDCFVSVFYQLAPLAGGVELSPSQISNLPPYSATPLQTSECNLWTPGASIASASSTDI